MSDPSSNDAAAQVRHVEVVVNPLSGSTGPGAVDQARRIMADHGLTGQVWTPGDDDLLTVLRRAMDQNPDLVAVVAGDGTARCAAELAGPDGPLVAPLPGGTMNMLPRRLYGPRSWEQAFGDILRDGEARTISGGEINGRTFFVAAILGEPAHWADAREAVREGRLWLAVQRARRALKRAFTGRLRYRLDDGPVLKTEALALMCPLVSRIMSDDEQALEATAVDPKTPTGAVRLGAHLAMGDWRADPSVIVGRCRQATAWASGRIPALLDGEPARLDRTAVIRFKPHAFRALVPRGAVEE